MTENAGLPKQVTELEMINNSVMELVKMITEQNQLMYGLTSKLVYQEPTPREEIKCDKPLGLINQLNSNLDEIRRELAVYTSIYSALSKII